MKLTNMDEAAALAGERDLLGELIARMERGDDVACTVPNMGTSGLTFALMFSPEFQDGARQAGIDTAKSRLKTVQARLKKLGVEIDSPPRFELEPAEGEVEAAE